MSTTRSRNQSRPRTLGRRAPCCEWWVYPSDKVEEGVSVFGYRSSADSWAAHFNQYDNRNWLVKPYEEPKPIAEVGIFSDDCSPTLIARVRYDTPKRQQHCTGAQTVSPEEQACYDALRAERDALSALSELHIRERDNAMAERDALHELLRDAVGELVYWINSGHGDAFARGPSKIVVKRIRAALGEKP